jgi:hypothetical protein
VAADVNRVMLGVVPVGDGHYVRLAIETGSGQPSQALASQILDLRRG